MTVWELVILIVVATACVTFGIGFVYSSIVNTIEQYQVRRAKRATEAVTNVINELPKLTSELLSKVKEADEKRMKKSYSDFRKEFEDE